MNTNMELKVGDVATYTIYTDRKVVDIVKVSASGKTVHGQVRTPELVKKPKMIPGGFAAIVVENAEWVTHSNPSGEIMKFTLRTKKNGTQIWKRVGSRTNSPGSTLNPHVDAYYYDYGF